jgi:hypothetical protein
MFYVDEEMLKHYRESIRELKEDVPAEISTLKAIVQKKLEQYPLLEYGAGQHKILEEYKQCKVNARQGRVILDTHTISL